MPSKVKMTCSNCGGENVFADAWAYWDIGTQSWVLYNVFDDKFCEDCDSSQNLNHTEVEPEELCTLGLHSWIKETGKLDDKTVCAYCDELYGDPD